MNLPGMSAHPLQSLSQPVHASVEQLLEMAVDLAADDMANVNATIQQRLNSDIALIRTLGAYIIQSGESACAR